MSNNEGCLISGSELESKRDRRVRRLAGQFYSQDLLWHNLRGDSVPAPEVMEIGVRHMMDEIVRMRFQKKHGKWREYIPGAYPDEVIYAVIGKNLGPFGTKIVDRVAQYAAKIDQPACAWWLRDMFTTFWTLEEAPREINNMQLLTLEKRKREQILIQEIQAYRSGKE